MSELDEAMRKLFESEYEDEVDARADALHEDMHGAPEGMLPIELVGAQTENHRLFDAEQRMEVHGMIIEASDADIGQYVDVHSRIEGLPPEEIVAKLAEFHFQADIHERYQEKYE